MKENEDKKPEGKEDSSKKGGFLNKLLGLVGIHLAYGKEDKLHITGRFFTIIGLFVVIGIVGFMGMYFYSTNPKFCNSCHIMKPYYKAWSTSSHNNVPCVDCHYPPEMRDKMWVKFQAMSQVAKYVTRTYSTKPYAEIEDSSCLRSGCHEKRLLEGKVTSHEGIHFDHGPHLKYLRRGKQLKCTSCHSQMVIGSHIEVTYSTCYLCHFKGKKEGRNENPLGGCVSCHEPPDKDIEFEGLTFSHNDFVGEQGVACQNCHLDAIQGDGDAPVERCMSCHAEPSRIAKADDVTFIHQNHVTEHKVDCTECHLEIKHAVKTTVKPLQYDCSICHERKHGAQRELYMGVGGKGDVKDTPSPMFTAQVDCIGCHVKPKGKEEDEVFNGKTYEASEAGCVGCHGRDFAGMLGDWQEMINESLASTKVLIDKYETAAGTFSGDGKKVAAAGELAKNAMYNYRFVLNGKGVHNVEYSENLLSKAKEDLETALAILSN